MSKSNKKNSCLLPTFKTLKSHVFCIKYQKETLYPLLGCVSVLVVVSVGFEKLV